MTATAAQLLSFPTLFIMSDQRPARASTPVSPSAGTPVATILRPVPVPRPKGSTSTPSTSSPSITHQTQHQTSRAPSAPPGTGSLTPQRVSTTHGSFPLSLGGTRSLSTESVMIETLRRLDINDSATQIRSNSDSRTRTKSHESKMRVGSVTLMDLGFQSSHGSEHPQQQQHSPQQTDHVQEGGGSDGHPSLEAEEDDTAKDSDFDEGEIEEKEPADYRQQGQEEYEEGNALNEPEACLFVASLSSARTDGELHRSVTDHFGQWGGLLNVKVLKDWMQRPYSFVQFERVDDARRALVEAQNTVLDGRPIRIEQARVNRTLFIQKFPRETTEEEMRECLGQFGPLEKVNIFHDRGATARFKRYAFAKFSYRDDAILAFVTLKTTSNWVVEWASNLIQQNPIIKEAVFVGQLNFHLITEERLLDRFGEYGKITRLNLFKKPSVRTISGLDRPATAFAFIEYDNERSASRAIELTDGTEFLGKRIHTEYREDPGFRTHRQQVAAQASNVPRPAAGLVLMRPSMTALTSTSSSHPGTAVPTPSTSISSRSSLNPLAADFAPAIYGRYPHHGGRGQGGPSPMGMGNTAHPIYYHPHHPGHGPTFFPQFSAVNGGPDSGPARFGRNHGSGISDGSHFQSWHRQQRRQSSHQQQQRGAGSGGVGSSPGQSADYRGSMGYGMGLAGGREAYEYTTGYQTPGGLFYPHPPAVAPMYVYDHQRRQMTPLTASGGGAIHAGRERRPSPPEGLHMHPPGLHPVAVPPPYGGPTWFLPPRPSPRRPRKAAPDGTPSAQEQDRQRQPGASSSSASSSTPNTIDQGDAGTASSSTEAHHDSTLSPTTPTAAGGAAGPSTDSRTGASDYRGQLRRCS
ncbi:hypothetical protein BGZ83_001968 [Gryganskiella cystojenkinii]|nr:hypothetical protein BGZ83_001968 [Gryganskiella cystojenkinii]